jgi:hypothetical protein
MIIMKERLSQRQSITIIGITNKSMKIEMSKLEMSKAIIMQGTRNHNLSLEI